MNIPIRIINNSGGIKETQKKAKWGGFRFFLGKILNLILILALLSSQVYLFSAFEAHVINVTAHICKPAETRTMGFWKNHYNAYKDCLPVTLGNYPSPDITLTNKSDVDEIFKAANADDMRDMLKGQLLAMKFNICYFISNDFEGEEFNGMTLYGLVAYADDLLRDPNATREELEEIKDLLDYLNNLHYIKYCSKLLEDDSIVILSEFSVGWVSDYLLVSDEGIDEKNQPETFITAHPQSPTENPEAYFAFGSSKKNAVFQCNISSSGWAICDSPKVYPGLVPGEYMFSVFTSDQKGNYDRTPAVFSWTITEIEELAEEPLVEELPLAPESEPYCGDGNIDDGEECDDGNTEDGDGCSANCILEVGEGSGPEPPVEPGPSCGDGIIDEGEQCDDGNIEDGDGCSANCILEVGEGSEPEPPVEPGPSCGDGIIDEGEQCDTGENNGVECVPEYGLPCDYCSLNCETVTITGPYCGDGNLDESYEGCDDGNTEDGDGCSANCAIEEVLPPVTECEPEAQQVCSTGLLGICGAGTQICDLEGFWGECLQDNQPTDEVCNNELDDNCDGNIDCGDSSCLEDESCLPPAE